MASRPLSGQLSKRELEELRRLKAVRMALDEWKKQGFDVDIEVCPICKSPRLVKLTSAHDLGVFPGSLQPALYCIDCGWYGRVAPVMSNREQTDAILEDMKGAFAPLMDPDDDPYADVLETDTE